MSRYDYDLFTLGAGSGGVRASRMAGQLGAKVAIAERDRVGGTCVIRGCIPKKLLSYAAHYAEDLEDARGFGWSVGEASFSWPALVAAKNREIARLEGVYRSALEKAGVATLRGTARLADPHTVEIGGERVTAKNILVATGGRPVRPAIPGAELAITSDEAFELPELPRRILIVGGGYIAVEFAGIFRGLGAEVTLCYRGAQILRGFDDDVRAHLHAEMAKKGVRVLLGSSVSRIARGARGLEADAGGRIECDAVMFATGRAPNTAGLGLAEAGVGLDGQGGVQVDRFCRSSVPHIYAAGDVTHRIALTPVAIREGAAVATTLFGGTETPVDHDDVPSAVFSQPPVGTVGLSEAKAAERLGAVDIYKASFRPLRHTLSGRDERTLVKLVVDGATQRVVGAHMVGADAPEIIQGVALAVKAGLTKAQFDATVGIHPTAAEEFVTLRERTAARPPPAHR
ncbi:MAG TPA: glutathione-disulfide reductase [Burkholderiales bacterium]|nr:glutathione-disulfide reductase [Burkholderiales bacterium]